MPETNSYGLVLPPSPEVLEYLSLFGRPKHMPETVDRHHLYWPERLYERNDLAKQFRRHRFNSAWMLISDHRLIHEEYDGVHVPPKDVMTTFLDEAQILDDLGVSVTALEMIDEAIYEGRVNRPRAVANKRIKHLELIHAKSQQIDNFEVMPTKVIQHVVQELGELPIAA